MGFLDRKYRDGVRAYILSLKPDQKKDFAYTLLNRIQLHKRDLRDLKEELMEEVQALAFLQEHVRVVPFNKEERDERNNQIEEAIKPARRKSRTA